MKNPFNRRDFLKMAGLLSMSMLLPKKDIFSRVLSKPGIFQKNPNQENLLIVVFDAWSAANMSLYGYPRETTPNLRILADKAIVYHNHFSNGNFTISGTASLLTGTLPWTHRALKLNDKVSQAFHQKNLFHAFQGIHRLAYSHNPLANRLLDQDSADIEDFLWWDKLYLDSDSWYNNLFKHDEDIASLSLGQALKQTSGHTYSLYLTRLYAYIQKLRNKHLHTFAADFPLGLPNYDDYTYFTLEQGIDWLEDRILKAPRPFLGYYHFFPPHDRYHTRKDFFDRFQNDGFHTAAKPRSIFEGNRSDVDIEAERKAYDEFVLYVDAEFSRLYEFMQQKGLLENTWLVLTSDHGEMLERGILGHITPVLYQPVVHVPLLIFKPGQTSRVDVSDLTSAVDLLPTLTQVMGQEVPGWAEGEVLPPFSTSSANSGREIYAFHGDKDKNGKITVGTAMIVREHLKLLWYFGYEKHSQYPNGEKFELYDLQADPEELNDLYISQPDAAAPLLEVLRAKLDKANAKL